MQHSGPEYWTSIISVNGLGQSNDVKSFFREIGLADDFLNFLMRLSGVLLAECRIEDSDLSVPALSCSITNENLCTFIFINRHFKNLSTKK